MHPPPGPEHCLHSGPCVNCDHPAVREQAASLASSGANPLESAVTLYYWVRDHIRYNPYGIALNTQSLSASHTLARGEGWCVPKAILLAALCRCLGIPARLGYADVRNHLSTERLRREMNTDIFYFHGYTSIYLNGSWVKATPAFNIELCEKFGLRPLEFNGVQDSLYHEFDVAGNRHMEYITNRGEFLEPPLGEMIRLFRQHYPGMATASADSESAPPGASWDADVALETGST